MGSTEGYGYTVPADSRSEFRTLGESLGESGPWWLGLFDSRIVRDPLSPTPPFLAHSDIDYNLIMDPASFRMKFSV